jgi:hypothetical protein
MTKNRLAPNARVFSVLVKQLSIPLGGSGEFQSSLPVPKGNSFVIGAIGAFIGCPAGQKLTILIAEVREQPQHQRDHLAAALVTVRPNLAELPARA